MKQIVAWAMTAIRYYELLHLGLGYHADSLPSETVEKYQKTFLAVQITWFTTAVLTKTSILLLYKRIFGVYEKFRKVIWAAIGLVVSYFIICTVLALAGCQPTSYFWNKHQPGKCINEVQFFRWNGVTNLILDFVVLLIPMPMVWNLQLRLRQKLAFTAIFGLGLLRELARERFSYWAIALCQANTRAIFQKF
ncbi:hypothetical protein PRZ48_003987 [Zasmidium cellare]|uniref:Rhodopsin domain-containing protein n=1 Tax=Zasmidium cellare TaxID=395010 RepID=A0ABR0EWL7_ZASCE|nr:hypothetical protein PRZ48_003987 [Zasmidium cellare]